MYHPLYPQRKTQIRMVPVSAVRDATSSSIHLLMLHVPLILYMGYVTFPTRLTSISVHGLPTLLMSSPLLRVDPRVVMLRTP